VYIVYVSLFTHVYNYVVQLVVYIKGMVQCISIFFSFQYCVDKMHHWLNVAPYRPERELEEGDYSRIIGCSFTDDK